MLHFVKCYESTKPSQHPVGMTYQHSGGSNSALFASEADWIAPGPKPGNYLTRPDTATGVKVIISDSDHIEGSFLSDPLWVYKNVFQGLNTLYMDRYTGSDALNQEQSYFAPESRSAMGQIRLIATLFDMNDMVPAPNLSTTGYALRGGKTEFSSWLQMEADSTRTWEIARPIPATVVRYRHGCS
jgi:hypothetical protein